jgi:hypothetical protein
MCSATWKPRAKRVFEKVHAGASRLSMMRMVAMSIMASDVCTLFVIFAESAITTEPSEAPLHDPGQAVILKARCGRLTICSFQPSSRMI